MVDFLNKLELSDHKYQTNEIVRHENYKGKYLFPMKYFVSSGTDCQSIFWMSIIFLKENIDGFCFPQFTLT